MRLVDLIDISCGLPDELHGVMEEYSNLEIIVRGLISEICSPFCTTCTNPCCRDDICRETLDSLWLSIIYELNHHEISNYNNSTGWLTDDGCGLNVGRPPVCYEFYCSTIMSELAGTYQKYAANVLGNLLSFIGKNAIGKKHLVTLTDPEEFCNVKFEKIQARIKTAHALSRDCIEMIRKDYASYSTLNALQLILKLPKGIK